MGGNALDNVRRLSNADHARLISLLVPKLRTHFARVGTPRYLPTKTSHGDIDFVVQGALKPATANSIRDTIAADLGALSKVTNGTISSFNVEGFQVDVNFLSSHAQQDQEEAVFNAYLGFMDWGDFSRIMGVIVKQFGLKWSSVGLELAVSDWDAQDSVEHSSGDIAATEPQKPFIQNNLDESNQPTLAKRPNPRHIGDIVLTHSFPDALYYFKYNPQKWIDGFLDEKDMFEYLVSSPTFSSDWMLGWAHSFKPNEKVRPAVSLFKEFLIERYGHSSNNSKLTRSEQDAYKMDALRHFGKLNEYNDILAAFIKKSALDEQMRASFNGELVMELTGLDQKHDGKKIGLIKSRVRALIQAQFENSDGDAWKREMAGMAKDDMIKIILKVWDEVK
ncbi:hypothetical protein HDU77_007775 [Chytriomyces hyalinus]|nr:hypothetical protein HDU77_007775 [Chytriomyces hyalinus]